MGSPDVPEADQPQRGWVAVIGHGTTQDPDILRAAAELGEGIALRGHGLVCGGLGGVMAATSKGARETGGTTVGILPGRHRTDANPWIDVAVPTGLGEARNALVVRSADIVIAVGGGWGTLSEIAFALRAKLPVIGLATWHAEAPEQADLVRHVQSVEEALAALDAFLPPENPSAPLSPTG